MIYFARLNFSHQYLSLNLRFIEVSIVNIYDLRWIFFDTLKSKRLVTGSQSSGILCFYILTAYGWSTDNRLGSTKVEVSHLNDGSNTYYSLIESSP